MTGRVIIAEDVRAALLTTLELWLPSALHAVCHQHAADLTKVRLPRTFQGLPEQAALRADQLPAVCAVVGRTDGMPVQDDDGSFSATWKVEASVVARGDNQETTRLHLSLYTAAVRMIVVQHGALGGFAVRSRWLGEEYDTFDASKSGTIAGGFVDLLVTVADVVDAYASPLVPPIDPANWPADPTVADVIVLEEPL